jgi:hypothetical protein
MAHVLLSQDSITLGTGSTDTYIVGDASDGVVGTILVHLDTTSAGTVSVVVKARPRSVPWATTTPPFLPIPYLSLCDGGSVVAGATYATAALTGDGDLILVPASGLSIALDVTYTDGTHVLRVERLLGASA